MTVLGGLRKISSLLYTVAHPMVYEGRRVVSKVVLSSLCRAETFCSCLSIHSFFALPCSILDLISSFFCLLFVIYIHMSFLRAVSHSFLAYILHSSFWVQWVFFFSGVLYKRGGTLSRFFRSFSAVPVYTLSVASVTFYNSFLCRLPSITGSTHDFLYMRDVRGT